MINRRRDLGTHSLLRVGLSQVMRLRAASACEIATGTTASPRLGVRLNLDSVPRTVETIGRGRFGHPRERLRNRSAGHRWPADCGTFGTNAAVLRHVHQVTGQAIRPSLELKPQTGGTVRLRRRLQIAMATATHLAEQERPGKG